MSKNNGISTLADLKQDQENARKHNPRNIGMIVKAINEVGVARSGVIDEYGNILAGNGTFEALSEAGIKKIKVVEASGEEWVVVKRSGMSDRQKKKLALYDNRTADLAEWDGQNLKFLESEFDGILDGVFTDLELKDIFLDAEEDEIGEIEGEDDVPEKTWGDFTKKGFLYQLGEHRLLCGDSTARKDVDRLMDGQKANMVFTDPPYNIDYQGVSDKREKIKNDKMPDSDFVRFLTSSLMGCETMYVCCSWQNAHLFKQAMINLARNPKAMIVWDKVNPAQHLDKYFKQHEIIFYYGDFGGHRTIRGDIWKLKRERNTFHPTMKPVELIEMALFDHPTKKNVFDPFGGSGSTLIACEKLNRKCYMMELDPKYCDVIVHRYRNLFPDKNIFYQPTGSSKWHERVII